MDHDRDLREEHVLVTGASRGIGFAIAQAFGKAGARTTILADDPEVFEAAERLRRETGAAAEAVRCDITDRAAVARSIAPLARLDVLVNNAGYERITPILEPDESVEATFRRIVEVNVIGTFNVTREALKLMRSGARIIFTASVWGKTAAAAFSGYCASKHANIGFMRALAQELGPHGISVNAVCPGWVRTEASLRSLEEDAARQGKSADALAAEMLRRQAIDGLMSPEDVVDAYLFLASRAARSWTESPRAGGARIGFVNAGNRNFLRCPRRPAARSLSHFVDRWFHSG
jgi:NAD(P)-dependent dehydrogenase (short-subunit alcohol dehydrogenase family)